MCIASLIVWGRYELFELLYSLVVHRFVIGNREHSSCAILRFFQPIDILRNSIRDIRLGSNDAKIWGGSLRPSPV